MQKKNFKLQKYVHVYKKRVENIISKNHAKKAYGVYLPL